MKNNSTPTNIVLQVVAPTEQISQVLLNEGIKEFNFIEEGEETYLRYKYWDELPFDAYKKVKDYVEEVIIDYDEDCGTSYIYKLTIQLNKIN
jgi:hypothetical protein